MDFDIFINNTLKNLNENIDIGPIDDNRLMRAVSHNLMVFTNHINYVLEVLAKSKDNYTLSYQRDQLLVQLQSESKKLAELAYPYQNNQHFTGFDDLDELVPS